MTRTLFDRALDHIRSTLQTLGERADNATERAMQALVDRDFDAAMLVKQEDATSDKLRYDLEHECVTVMATQNPVARDLREVLAATFVATELERCGDYAKGIAKAARRISQNSNANVGPYNLLDMSRAARELLQRSTKAFLNKDADAARALVDDDEYINKLYNDFVVYATTLMTNDPVNIEDGIWLMHAGHCLERIGDRATNIAERVIFMQEGALGDLKNR